MTAIYEFDGPDKYKVCFDPAGPAVPKKFATDVEENSLLKQRIEKLEQSESDRTRAEKALNGVDTLREIRKIDSNVGVIMVTADINCETCQQAVKLGAFDYVTKPIDFDYLEMAIMVKYIKQIG